MNQGFPPGLLSRERIARGGVEWSGRVSGLVPEGDAADAPRLADPVAIALRAAPAGGDGVAVQVGVEATAVLRCRRCLADVEREFALELELRFDPDISVADEEEALYALDPEADEVDLAPALREEILLALPTYPLCRPECRGLCPRCGTDRNERDCGCVADEPDPRWDALRREAGTSSPVAGGDDGTEADEAG
ncbi:MAG: DUF177 domain-containing protein [Gemmatimonadota bacterium]|nr:DUF177 domain-containing protein [Gemmatimonadota bacterium]